MAGDGIKECAGLFSVSVETVDLSDPAGDFSKYRVETEDIVLIALPSYGGRVPALATERLSQIKGNSANCVLLCVYGNRAYEDTLIEMADIAKKCGFHVAAAVSAVAEHSIMHQFAAGRPDEEDEQKLKSYAGTFSKRSEQKQRTGNCRYRETVLTKKQAVQEWFPKLQKTV